MKICCFLIILSIYFLFHGCSSNELPVSYNIFEIAVPDYTSIPDSIKNMYYKDAGRLALRYFYTAGRADTLLIEIPGELINVFYRGLIHIYNSVETEHVNFITRINPIHTFPKPDVNMLDIAVNKSYSWTKAWINGNIETNNDKINDLILPYDFKLLRCFPLANYHVAVLETNKLLNLSVLSNEIEKIPGVIHSNPAAYGGDGDDIKVLLFSGSIEFIFSKGWNDCRSGCIERHYWKYRVWPNGYIRFIEEYGDTLEIDGL